ncbi:MAG: ABC transporter permease subunit, partial [Dongiaceae bacterium]
IGEGLKIAIIIKGCFQPFAINTLSGIRSVSSRYHDVARVLELGRWDTLRRVTLPAVLPTIFSGGRMALGQAWMVLVTAEMLASAEGIGYVMSWARLQFQLDVLLVAMIAVGAAGWFIDLGARLLERRISGWYGHAS